jgi:KDO2-lipid IV(A) lauroyltransferase
MHRKKNKKIRYALEGFFLFLFSSLFSVLTLTLASKFAGWIGKTVGPKLAASRKAKRHLNHALPNLSDTEQTQIINGMWENLAQVMGEYPHLETIAKNNVEIIGLDKIIELRDNNQPAIFFGGHTANWEIASPSFYQHGLEVDLVYRAPNNPYADKILNRMRSLNGKLRTYSKSPQGIRQLVKALKSGRSVGILIDQKYNEGIPVPFFGTDAMTSTAFIQLAQKFKYPLIPTQVERIGLNNFRITVHPELELYNKDGSPKDLKPLIETAHSFLETWISAKPSQWLWLHKRWGKNVR